MPKKKLIKVFTNGCFDILHIGHVEYLKAARKRGDYLIVGLNSDSSVRQLKGPLRPINSFIDRSSVLLALTCVDEVIEFDELTPINLIKRLKPDVLVKGGDYNAESVIGYDYVTSNGGSVVVEKFIPGKSTSIIIEKIQKWQNM
ncbi:D-glycero-beta-D-manno-heptose 1-phosphate adenylyltransferase [Planktomarina temperata]|nr:D-glycero-beta-D-manno-heptose 1-phosphate adenylyltransferase [Planktomarina temperata]